MKDLLAKIIFSNVISLPHFMMIFEEKIGDDDDDDDELFLWYG